MRRRRSRDSRSSHAIQAEHHAAWGEQIRREAAARASGSASSGGGAKSGKQFGGKRRRYRGGRGGRSDQRGRGNGGNRGDGARRSSRDGRVSRPEPSALARVITWLLLLTIVGAVGVGVAFLVVQRGDIASWVRGTTGTVTGAVSGAYESRVEGASTDLPEASLPQVSLPTSERSTDPSGRGRGHIRSPAREEAEAVFAPIVAPTEATPAADTAPTEATPASTPVPVRTFRATRAPESATLWANPETISETEKAIHLRINIARTSGAGWLHAPLQWDEDLASVARAHSEDMAARNYMNHDTPEGLDPTDRLHRAGFSCRKTTHYGIGENIAIESSLDSVDGAAEEAVAGWVGSPGHRRVLMGADYDRTGVGAALGTYQGRRALYLTQVFC